MAVYSMIQFTSVSLLYRIASNLADLQFLFIDIGLIIPIAVFMSESGPHSDLDPKRPTASLMSRKVLSSMLGQVGIQSVLQVVIYFWIQTTDFYEPPNVDVEDHMYKCFENSVSEKQFLMALYLHVSLYRLYFY
jgi:cation-transporting P-type ATPase 13A2